MRKWRLTSAFYSGERRQSQTELCLCIQGLIAEHSDNIGRLSAIFRQQHPSGKVMTSQGDLKPGAAFLCSQITNTYTVPPPGAFRATAKCPPNDFNVGTIKL